MRSIDPVADKRALQEYEKRRMGALDALRLQRVAEAMRGKSAFDALSGPLNAITGEELADLLDRLQSAEKVVASATRYLEHHGPATTDSLFAFVEQQGLSVECEMFLRTYIACSEIAGNGEREALGLPPKEDARG